MSRVEQQRNIIDYTLSSLLRRPFKNSLLILVYTLIIFSLGSVLLFTRAIRKEASILLREAPDMIVQRIVAGRHDLIPLSYLDTIASIEGTAAVRERLWGYYFDSAKGANYTLIVPATCGLRPGEVAIGVGVAAVRNVYKGEKLFFKAYNGEVISLRIRGILAPGSELIAADLIYICGDDFRKVFGVPEGYATDLVLKAVNREDVKAIASKVSIALPDTRSITQDEILGIYDTIFDWRGDLVGVVLTGAVFAFLILAWDKATGLSPEEKREIGILKAIGWNTSDVLLMKVWESSIISVSSFLAGILLAYLHVFVASSSLFEPVLIGWSVLYPEFKLIPFVDFNHLAILFFMTVVPYTAATILISWRAATISPDAVIR